MLMGQENTASEEIVGLRSSGSSHPAWAYGYLPPPAMQCCFYSASFKKGYFVAPSKVNTRLF